MNDPLFIDHIYRGPGKRTDKYKTSTYPMMAPGASIATPSHELHRSRRHVLNQFFSKKSIRKIEPLLQHALSNLLERMQGWAVTGTPAPMNLVFKAATKDIVSNYAFGKGASNSLEREDFDVGYFNAVPHGPAVFFAFYFHGLARLMTKLPISMVVSLNPSLGVFIKYIQVTQSLRS